MAKIKNVLIIAFLTAIAILTLKECSAHIKIAVGGLLAWISHLTASDWANYVTIAYGVLQIISLIYDQHKKHKDGN